MSRKLVIVGLVLVGLGVAVAIGVNSFAAERNKIPDELRAALLKPDVFELYSLNPSRRIDKEKIKEEDLLHGYEIYGKLPVKDADTQKKLVTAFQKGVDANKGEVAACFNPRHAIRVKRIDKVYDFVICFQCSSVNVYVDGKQTKGFLITDLPADTFNKILTDAKIKIDVPEK